MIVTVTGATGFVGRPLVAALRAGNHEVRVLARDPASAERALGIKQAWKWDGGGLPPVESLAGASAVISLAGEPIADGRWTAARKAALRSSRIDATRNLVRAIGQANPRPGILISGSAVGYYGDHPEGDLDENAAPGHDFLADLCREWEIAAQNAESLGMRVVYLRTGVVVGRGGGALSKMLLPFKLGAGGPTGSGRQWMSWIHLEDEVGLIVHALENDAVRGPLNATAPNPVRNADFTRALGRALHRPALLPTPALALKLMFGEMAGMLLTGQKVVPAKALATGYRFRYPESATAIAEAVGGSVSGVRA